MAKKLNGTVFENGKEKASKIKSIKANFRSHADISAEVKKETSCYKAARQAFVKKGDSKAIFQR
ncbi:MAG: hypothetical protein LBU87_05785 [Lactobacillales bacterium]|jgi:hypothetical protein|nr:hypothetical protein [Lactobacillales bacterium]